MHLMADDPQLRESVVQSAKQQFPKLQQLVYRRTDRMFVALMALQWLACVILALCISPKLGPGGEIHSHPHLWIALFLGGAIIFLPVLLGWLRPGATSTRHVIAVGQMLIGAVLMHMTGGHIETHFHVFVSLCILAFYCDWRILVTATLVVTADHFLGGRFWPDPVPSGLNVSNWQALEHVAWVVLADILLIISCLRSQREMWNKALKHAQHDATEKDFRQMADAMPQIVWTANPAGWLDYYNKRWFDYTGLTPKQTEACGWQPVLHPDDLEQSVELWSNAVRTGEEYEVEYRFKRASDGVYRWHLGRATAVRDHEGRIIKWFGTSTDIDDQKRAEEVLEIGRGELESRVKERTAELVRVNRGLQDQIAERQRAEEALAISEKRYRELVDNGLGLICTHDLQGKLLSVNPAAAEALDYTPAEMVGNNLCDYIAPAARPFFPEYLEGIAAEPSQSGLMNIRNRAGEERIWMYRNSRIGETPKDAYVLGYAQDITEQKKVETELKQRELELIEAQHIAMTGNWEWEIAGSKMTWSVALYSIYGFRPEDIIPTYEGYLDLVHPDDREHVSVAIETALKDRQGCAYQTRIIRPDKSIRHHHVNVKVVLGDNGQPVKLFGTAQDVTDRVHLEHELKKARDAAVESARLKSEFLANMSHEIRTPMNGVVGMTGLLLDSELDANQRDIAETIRSSSDALLTIINDILDFSKIEAGKLEFETVDFDLRNAVEETMELLAERARAKQIEFASLIYRDVPTGLRGDPGRLRQVLTNLVGNALKFTEHGEIIVRGEKENENETAVTIRFTVTDTGIGISPAAQANLFQLFTQADGSTTRKYGGTGLGLSISKQLVELMGGEIGVVSQPDQGSTFWFTVRLEKQPPERASAGLPTESIEKLRVLVVDDNATNRKILSHQLGSWGMIHAQADSGQKALEILRTAAAGGAAYDLVILDHQMPGMDGFQLARAIKADSMLARLNLVLLTSAGIRGDSAASPTAEIAAYLTKPVRQSQLFDCLTMVVSSISNASSIPAPTVISKHTLREAKRMSNELILLAEDNIVNQKVAVRQLQKLGYRADTVANGRQAVEALSRKPYDLVLMDCQMPEMDGYEATLEIRRREGTSKHTPIVAMTAHALTGDREKSLAAGMDDHISKPVKQAELARVLGNFFAGSNQSLATKVAAQELTAPVDLERLHQALGDDPVEISEILDLYCVQTEQSLIKLGAAISSGNSSDIDLIAHNCAGTSANCGMVALVNPMLELERMGRENQFAGARFLHAQACKEFERVKLFLAKTFEPLVAQ